MFDRQFAKVLETMPAVLATVIQTQGSVPREVGAKMLICADGQVLGTIGGGAGEAKVIQHARSILETGQKRWVEIDLTGAPQRETQGVCGGVMRVWLERWQGDRAISLVRQIVTLLESGQSVTIITPFDQRSPYLSEDCPAQAFLETLQPAPTLLIVGAGHCGIQLARVADLIGFQVIVQDDRPEWANPELYPTAKVANCSIDRIVSDLANHTELYAALVTRGYQFDLAALAALLNRALPCRYLGMIGSKKRVRKVYQALEGISPEKLRSIYAPIGLDIGALTPEEIAVSIGAELILVRRGGTGRSLSER
ncbi:MAG: XdhC family protein [Leptolyngbya sp. Prado105]|jgi:xanthine dehydrogenase accessory factor|nr:XdhC family protein [Leptolyngbya sp. Prado105]